MLFLAPPSFARDIPETTDPLLSKITFPTSANPTAKTYFEKGVLFLQSFECERARTAFQHAEKADPNFALAYWGEEMTYNYPVLNDQDLNAAKNVLRKLAPTDTQRVEKKILQQKRVLSRLLIYFM